MSAPISESKQVERHVRFAEDVQCCEIYEKEDEQGVVQYFPLAYLKKIEEKNSRRSMNWRRIRLSKEQIYQRNSRGMKSLRVSHQWAKLQDAIHQYHDFDLEMIKALDKVEAQSHIQNVYHLSQQSQSIRFHCRRFSRGFDLLGDDIQTLDDVYKMIIQVHFGFKNLKF